MDSAQSQPGILVPVTYSGTYSPQIWEYYKEEISELYAVNTLKKVMDEMQARHGFSAPVKKWKSQLSKWNLSKRNIKQAEYRAMIRKKKEREQAEPGKATQFILNGVEVPPEKLERYESQENKNDSVAENYRDATTPPGLICRTPPLPQSSYYSSV